jgi:hypothetical protein
MNINIRDKLFLIVFLLVITFGGSSTVLSHSYLDHHMSPIGECDDASVKVFIESQENLVYSLNVIEVPQNSCVEFEFKNTVDIAHDFTLEREDGSIWVNLPVENSTDPSTPNPGLLRAKLQMPTEDITLPYYCSVTGHREAGEEGTLIVGEGGMITSHSHDDTESKTESNSEEKSDNNDSFIDRIYVGLGLIVCIIFTKSRNNRSSSLF